MLYGLIFFVIIIKRYNFFFLFLIIIVNLKLKKCINFILFYIKYLRISVKKVFICLCLIMCIMIDGYVCID